MARHPELPKTTALVLSKTELLNQLKSLDDNAKSRERILKMETVFREKIKLHVDSLPTKNARFAAFNTSPFVLLFYSLQHCYSHILQIEQAILPAKVFSSIETSAGRMVEQVVFPEYGWEIVTSGMHTVYSAIDGKKRAGGTLCLATLKSGPRCLNDEMSENLADAIVNNHQAWASDAGVKNIEFTYGVLYGTRKQSNKKDWHILRNIAAKVPDESVIVAPADRWDCKFKIDDVTVNVNIRIGIALWDYIAGQNYGFLEVAVALIRACVSPTDTEPQDYKFSISDMENIISLRTVPKDFNVAILQRSQLEWLFFFAFHFCDRLVSIEQDLL